MPNFKNRGIFVLFIVAIAAVAFASLYFSGLKPVKADASLNFKIETGDGFKEIAANLSQAGVIKSIAAFKLYSILSGSAQYLEPGTYQISGHPDVPQLVGFLIKGAQKDIEVKIMGGITLKEIDHILSSKDIIPAGSLVNFDFKNSGLAEEYPYLQGVDSLEGFLYPDTYRFKTQSSAKEVVKKFVNNFQEKIWPLIGQKNNWYDILVLGSILDKEVSSFEDRQLVAGILSKRVKVGMPLQVDATVAYAKCQGDFSTCPRQKTLLSDLKIDSPYNSYLNLGLPPTPIVNTEKGPILAALSPKASDYWFFLSANATKETIFSKTYEEHNQNRQKYLK